MNAHPINPLNWQDAFDRAQAAAVKPAARLLYCAGQAATDATGKPVGGSMNEQMAISLRNLRKVIQQAGHEPANIVRLNLYTTSIPDLFASYSVLAAWLKAHRCKPASTLVHVAALAAPELTVEIEATVVG